ncbi:MAG: hypothetical protein ACTSU5_15640, partial [Promethearchaeota archaeon]
MGSGSGRPGGGEEVDMAYYREVWGFDPARVRRAAPEGSDLAYSLEDGFPLDAPGDELLDRLGVTLWARVEVDFLGRVHNRLVLRGGGREAVVGCVHLAVYEAPLGELAGLGGGGLADLARSTEGRPVDLPPLEHFAALRSFAAGLAELGVLNLLAGAGAGTGVNSFLVEQLGAATKEVFLWIAGNPRTPPGDLERLAGDPDPRVQGAVAGNPNTPPEVLERLWAVADLVVAARALANPNCPPRLARTPLGEFLAAKPVTTRAALLELAGDGSTPPVVLA